MKKSAEATGFAPVEVLSLIGAIVFLLVILLALQGTRSMDPRMFCGTNLSNIGKAMMLYSNDCRDELPRAGGGNSQWTGRVADWQAKDRNAAYGLGTDGAGGQVSISASLYLLVKYTEITPKSFVCRADRGAKEFKLEDYRVRDSKLRPADLWDFGPNPPKQCSYAYQMLYGGPTLTVSSEPDVAIAADRNPWMDEKKAKSFSRFKPAVEPFKGTAQEADLGNAVAHKGVGQNVMFLDTHVEFKHESYCALADDNIYTFWDGKDKIRGKPPTFGSQPADKWDSLLVNDPPASRK